MHPRPEPAGNSPSPHALWAADGPKVEPQTDRPVGNITVMHWSCPGQPGPVNPGQIRALFVQRQDTAGVKAECFSLGSSTHTQKKGNRATVEDGWEVSSVGIKNIIRGDIWAGSIWTRNLGRTLNLWESKGFAVTSKFSWLCVSVFSFSFLKNNRARGEEGGEKNPFAIFHAGCCEKERESERSRALNKEAEREGRKRCSCVPLAVRRQPVQHFVASSHLRSCYSFRL